MHELYVSHEAQI